jgi:hypothetical protein
MSILCILSLVVLVAMPVAGASQPVAIVYSLSGEASLAAPTGRHLRLFDRLPSRATVEVGPGSRLALAFASGLRYEMEEGSRATLGTTDFASRSGPVHPLSRVPPLPCLAPIAEDDQPGPRAGAVRIRAERISGLYPRRGAAIIAGEAVLRFKPVEKGGPYRVEVQDDEGQVVFRVDVEAPLVKVPGRALLPGARYYWTVRTLNRAGSVVRGEADFVALPKDAARAREELRAAVAAEGNGESLALLAAIDRSLGMQLEARKELQAALERSPGNAALDEELAALDQQLEEDGDEPEPY